LGVDALDAVIVNTFDELEDDTPLGAISPNLWIR
jgi:hypothetical protein